MLQLTMCYDSTKPAHIIQVEHGCNRKKTVYFCDFSEGPDPLSPPSGSAHVLDIKSILNYVFFLSGKRFPGLVYAYIPRSTDGGHTSLVEGSIPV